MIQLQMVTDMREIGDTACALCLTIEQQAALKERILAACIQAGYVGIAIGLTFGAVITYLALRRRYVPAKL